MLEKYPVFRMINDDTVHIKVPKERVAKGLLFFSIIFLSFAVFIIYTLLKSHQPLPTLLFSIPPIFFAIITFGLYNKWYQTGQVVKVDKNNNLLILKEKLANYIVKTKKYKIDDIKNFIVTPYVAYRTGSSPNASRVIKGYCVMIQFVRKKLFWFIEKDNPIVNIGAYLKREEAEALRLWLIKKALK